MRAESLIERPNSIHVEEPYLMVPQHLTEKAPSVEVIQVFPVVMPPAGLRLDMPEPFVPVPLDEIKLLVPQRVPDRTQTFSSTVKEAPISEPDFSAVEISEGGLVIMRGGSIDTADDMNRGTIRRVQRMDQYWRLMSTVNQWEVAMDKGRLKPDEVRAVAPLLRRFRDIGIYRYADEFASDPLSHELAENLNTRLAQDKRDLMEGKPKPARKMEKKLGDQLFDSEGMKTGTRTDEMLQDEQAQRQESEEEKAAVALLNNITALQEAQENEENIEQNKKMRESGTLYVHDPVLDEPSAEAAAFVEELMNRKF